MVTWATRPGMCVLSRCMSIGPSGPRVEHHRPRRPATCRIAEVARRPDSNSGAARRVVVHDFSGHPFQAQLARSLARRGLDVTHAYCASFQTPHGAVGDSGAPGYRSVGIPLRSEFSKYSALQRAVQELEYGWRFLRLMRTTSPDVVISANAPLISALVLQLGLRLRRVPIVFWQQDIYSTALSNYFERRGGRVNRLIGRAFVAVEKWLLRSSAQVVVISEDFLDLLREWGIAESKVSVVRNWAPLDEVAVSPRPNPWSERHHITDDQTVLLYAGTLGLKHQPELLLALAEAFADRDDVRVIVASEGLGATWLAERIDGTEMELIPFQPYADLPDMLGSGDVLLVLLEPDAGVFSVPSKVLTYHCAGRAILGAIPSENLAARTIEANGAGVVVDPGDSDGFVAAARRLIDDPARRVEMGVSARAAAETTFDIDTITDEFVGVLDAALGEPVAVVQSAPDVVVDGSRGGSQRSC
jgi:colanic acid biosynthesis glycosyl transferase WcaI